MKHRFVRLFAGSVLAAAVSAAWAAPADDAAVHFDINHFEVSGNTLLPAPLIDSLLAPFAGKDRDFGDIQRALEALENAYHARGYSVVQIELPEQELNRGVVVLKVVQTKIGRVKVTGNQYFDEANVRRSLPGLHEGVTPNLLAVSKDLKLANENPAKKVTLKLRSGERDDEVDAALEVADERIWKGIVNLDNTGTPQTGKTHAGFVLQNANLWGLDHVLSLQYTTTLEEPSRVSVYGVGYHVPLYALGDSLDFFGSYSNVDSGTVSAGIFDLAVSGKGRVFGARYNQNFAKVGNYEPKLVYGIDYKAYQSSVLLLGHELGNDVTVHPLSVNYLGNWTLAAGEANLSLTLLHNIAGGAHGGQSDFTLARAGAKANYTMLRLAANVTRALPGDWQLRAIVNGQYSADALIPGEQFGAGGASSVRGFSERDIANDSGLTGNFEVYSPGLCGQSLRWQCRALAFYDSAHVTRNHALPGELQSTSISSAGLGLRLQYANNVNLQLDYGHVLRADGSGRADRNRLHFRLALSY
ncbi:ShlB/FhaC/HecB family hemolysin secretion/activation protein [Janthinobacterium sp.]|uniref:ShlB/FhaC/HecB family hemolysin secretion/activation protein n=1 Tax=Janthinobacterium sp. TaxID=1871054 RepID=UPI00293D54A7|nr:ShlB/FhaC/HecB family hemolysin secretion/activation protein [Janthinobacterium sp.]